MQLLIVMLLGILGMVAGASAVLQQVLVASLRSTIGSVSWAVLISYIGGTLTMALVVMASRDKLVMPSAQGSGFSWAPWVAGTFGVIYIMIAVLLIPRLGAATVLALLVAGQLLASITFDHFGLFGLPQQPADLSRLAGAVLLIAGVILIRR
jgi:bacterial/archaeal transporter family-2 protein